MFGCAGIASSSLLRDHSGSGTLGHWDAGIENTRLLVFVLVLVLVLFLFSG